MASDLKLLGEDLIAISSRLVRWTSKGAEIDLSIAATRILARLADNGPTRIGDLAIAEHCSQPTITNHVKRLEAMQLVDRTVDPRDARAWQISLSERGLQQLIMLRQYFGGRLEPHLARLDPAELDALRAGLDVMRHLIDAEPPVAGP